MTRTATPTAKPAAAALAEFEAIIAEPAPAAGSSTDPAVLMAAIVAMANRMAMTTLDAGLARVPGDSRRHLDASERQRKALMRLMSALGRAQGDPYALWHSSWLRMTIRDSLRREARREREAASKSS